MFHVEYFSSYPELCFSRYVKTAQQVFNVIAERVIDRLEFDNEHCNADFLADELGYVVELFEALDSGQYTTLLPVANKFLEDTYSSEPVFTVTEDAKPDPVPRWSALSKRFKSLQEIWWENAIEVGKFDADPVDAVQE